MEKKFTCTCEYERRETLTGSGDTAREAWDNLHGSIIDKTDVLRDCYGAEKFRLFLDGKEVDRDLWDPMETCLNLEFWLKK